MVFFIKPLQIIVTNGVDLCGTFLGAISHHIVRSNCDGGISVWIIFDNCGIKLFCDFKTVSHMGVVNLVSD